MLNIEVDTVDLTVIPISEAEFNFREKQKYPVIKDKARKVTKNRSYDFGRNTWSSSMNV